MPPLTSYACVLCVCLRLLPLAQPSAFVDNTRLVQASLAKYFNKRLFSDITVIGPDGRKLLCHQVVLSAGSKRFANMLEQGAQKQRQQMDGNQGGSTA